MFARSNLGSVGDWRTAVPFAVRPTPETIQHCSDWNNYWLWAPGCWSYSRSDWQTMAKFQTPPAPPAVAAPPAATWTKPPESKAAAEATIDAVIADQNARWKADLLKFFQSQPYVEEPSSDSTLVWVAAAVAAVSLFSIWRN